MSHTLLGAGGSVTAGFIPSGAPNLVGWWGARFETAYANDDAVTTAHDQSTSLNNLTGVGSSAPTYSTVTLINGRQTFSYDGTDDFLEATGTSGVSGWSQDPFTVFVVIRPSAVVEEDFFLDATAGDTHALLMLVADGPYFRGHAWQGAGAANVVNGTSAKSSATNYIVAQRYDPSSNNEVWVNGALETAVVASGTTGTGPNTISLGGGSGRGASRLQGFIAEAVFYTTQLSTSDMTRVFNYLNTIYAVY